MRVCIVLVALLTLGCGTSQVTVTPISPAQAQTSSQAQVDQLLLSGSLGQGRSVGLRLKQVGNEASGTAVLQGPGGAHVYNATGRLAGTTYSLHLYPRNPEAGFGIVLLHGQLEGPGSWDDTTTGERGTLTLGAGVTRQRLLDQTYSENSKDPEVFRITASDESGRSYAVRFVLDGTQQQNIQGRTLTSFTGRWTSEPTMGPDGVSSGPVEAVFYGNGYAQVGLLESSQNLAADFVFPIPVQQVGASADLLTGSYVITSEQGVSYNHIRAGSIVVDSVGSASTP